MERGEDESSPDDTLGDQRGEHRDARWGDVGWDTGALDAVRPPGSALRGSAMGDGVVATTVEDVIVLTRRASRVRRGARALIAAARRGELVPDEPVPGDAALDDLTLELRPPRSSDEPPSF